MENKKYDTEGTVAKSNRKTIETKPTPLTQIHHRSSKPTPLTQIHHRSTKPTPLTQIHHRSTKPTPLTQIHDRSLSWLAAYNSIKGGGVKLICVMLDKVHLHPCHFLPNQ